MLDYKNLHAYQLSAIDHMLEKPKSGVFLEMGLGKTVSTLTAINTLLFEDFEVDKVLVIGPKRVAESVWHREVKNWEHLKHIKVTRIIGTEAQRTHALNTESDVYTLGRDNVAWLCAKMQDKVPFDMLVVDESSSFKNPKSVRFKALKKIMVFFKRVVLLTGTPAPNGLLDLWSQIYLLDRGERLGRTFTEYKGEYFIKGWHFGTYKPRKHSEDEIHRKIKDICISMKAKDYLKLPERIDNFIRIDFPKTLNKKYIDFEKESILEMFDTEEDMQFEVTALNAAALGNKLLQFCNGAVYDEERNVNVVHDLKIKALEEIIEGAQGKPVLLFWNFRHDISRIQEKLGKKYNIVPLKGNKEIDDWNNGSIEVMSMHPASGAHGLNLQKGGNIIVWYGLNWSLELYQQANARLHRQGQKNNTIINHIVVNNTMDMEVSAAIQRKTHNQEALMSAVKAKISKYKSL